MQHILYIYIYIYIDRHTHTQETSDSLNCFKSIFLTCNEIISTTNLTNLCGMEMSSINLQFVTYLMCNLNVM